MKGQSNLVIAGSLRNIFRYSVVFEGLDATNNLNVVEVNEPVQSKTVAIEQEFR